MSDQGPPNDEPELPVDLPITKEWRDRVKEELEARNWFQNDLARAAGVTPATVSNVLLHSQHSEAVGPISRALGIPIPFAPIADERELVWLGIGKSLRALDHKRFDRELARLAKLVGELKESR